VATGTDEKIYDAMADLASDAAERNGGILFTTLMVMLVSLDSVGQVPVISSDLLRYPTASSGP
jgi:hypothetical protein